jgi:hypothetical protein
MLGIDVIAVGIRQIRSKLCGGKIGLSRHGAFR